MCSKFSKQITLFSVWRNGWLRHNWPVSLTADCHGWWAISEFSGQYHLFSLSRAIQSSNLFRKFIAWSSGAEYKEAPTNSLDFLLLHFLSTNTNRIDVVLCIQYFAICAFQLTVCLVQIMSILKGNCKSFSFLHPCICNSACYISLDCLLVWKWCQYWEEMVRSLQWEHRHGVGAGCWRVHILMSRVFLDAQALGDLALMTSMIKPRFSTWLAWLKKCL